MRAGTLRHRLTFQSPGLTQDPVTGEMLEGWVTIWEKVPASIQPLSTRDLIAAQANQSEISGRIVIRYRVGVLPTMRIIHRDKIYNIQGPPLPDKVSGLEYLTLSVSTGVNNG
jgi:SPP1 family predicted phage head-tail adaptor